MSNAQSTSPDIQTQQLADRQAVADLIARVGVMLDEKRFEDAPSILSDDVTVQTPAAHPAAARPSWHRRSEATRSAPST